MSVSKPKFLDDYIPVVSRLAEFFADYQEGRVHTSLIEHDRESRFALVKAELYRARDDAEPAATGHAYETGVDYYIELAETHATGRALMLMGYEAKRGPAPVGQNVRGIQDKACASEALISEAMLRSISGMWETCISLGDSEAALRAWLKDNWGVTSRKQLTEGQAREVARLLSARISAIKSGKKL